MGDTLEKQKKNHISIGLLAHVDAGKTTLAESILYTTGGIRKPGRVDHQDAFLDTHELERERGITIFSKQALVSLGDKEVTLLDTPGHVDFSAEMERTLQVLDYAVLVISGADGVQSHVLTLWRLLKRYEIPTFLFINKMDQEGTDRERLMEELTKRLDERCVFFGDYTEEEEFLENLAVCDEKVLEKYLDTGKIHHRDIVRLIKKRKVFPCFFGSALKIQGVDRLLQGIENYAESPDYGNDFGARVYKIARDAQGNRLTYMKVTGGVLKVKMLLTNKRPGDEESAEELWEEKADQIRIYSGAGFEAVQEAQAGSVCAVTGLSRTYCGQGLGAELEAELPVLEPVLTYRILLEPDSDVHRMFLKLRELEEEIPELHIVWAENSNEIHAQVMGEVQMEILRRLIWERFREHVDFGEGSIVYKETIANPVEGVGHFEPLRHYAEVHLLLEPGERGSGLLFDSSCSEDILDRNWQRLVLTHLEEKKHRGVLTGSEITDMRISLITGRAHNKHTEGGDFRQATYRAVRQGLCSGESILLEPVYDFTLEVPTEKLGRAISDIQRMSGSFGTPETQADMTIITGTVPVSEMRGYQTELLNYTSGLGRLNCNLKGYEVCHNAEQVIAEIRYDAEADTDNPTGSVFCAHGAGFVVPWEQVPDYMHVDSGLELGKEEMSSGEKEVMSPRGGASAYTGMSGWKEEKELEEIFAKTYGSAKKERNHYNRSRTVSADTPVTASRTRSRQSEEEYLLVDGYNIIFAWDELKELADANIESARNKLMDILSNYQGYKKNTLILVFDAYKVKGNPGEIMRYHNIHVVYTKEAETADQYIEKTVHEIGRKYRVTVATSDALEQVIILGQGASRMSARGLYQEIEECNIEIRSTLMEKAEKGKNYLFSHMSEDMAELMEEVRLGRKKLDE